jgi:hypothetical protein
VPLEMGKLPLLQDIFLNDNKVSRCKSTLSNPF